MTQFKFNGITNDRFRAALEWRGRHFPIIRGDFPSPEVRLQMEKKEKRGLEMELSLEES